MRRRCLLPWLIAAALTMMFAGTVSAQSPTTNSQAKKPNRPPEPMEIKEVQEVSPVESVRPPTSADWIGKMHPALVHIPIGWMVLLLLVEIVATATGSSEWARAGFVLLIGVLVSLLPAMVTGLLRAASMGNEPEFLELMATHRNLNIAAGLTCLLALAVRYAWREHFTAGMRRAYLLLLAGATLLMLLAGHLGGKMVFGKDYLPF